MSGHSYLLMSFILHIMHQMQLTFNNIGQCALSHGFHLSPGKMLPWTSIICGVSTQDQISLLMVISFLIVEHVCFLGFYLQLLSGHHDVWQMATEANCQHYSNYDVCRDISFSVDWAVMRHLYQPLVSGPTHSMAVAFMAGLHILLSR